MTRLDQVSFWSLSWTLEEQSTLVSSSVKDSVEPFVCSLLAKKKKSLASAFCSEEPTTIHTFGWMEVVVRQLRTNSYNCLTLVSPLDALWVNHRGQITATDLMTWDSWESAERFRKCIGTNSRMQENKSKATLFCAKKSQKSFLCHVCTSWKRRDLRVSSR